MVFLILNAPTAKSASMILMINVTPTRAVPIVWVSALSASVPMVRPCVNPAVRTIPLCCPKAVGSPSANHVPSIARMVESYATMFASKSPKFATGNGTAKMGPMRLIVIDVPTMVSARLESAAKVVNAKPVHVRSLSKRTKSVVTMRLPTRVPVWQPAHTPRWQASVHAPEMSFVRTPMPSAPF